MKTEITEDDEFFYVRISKSITTLKEVQVFVNNIVRSQVTEGDKAVVIEAVQKGVSGYLLKPFTSLQVENALKKSLYDFTL